METETFISMSAASTLYGVSRKTIARLIKKGDLPYHRIGRQIRLSLVDLHNFTGRYLENSAAVDGVLGTEGSK
jgi:excisionase family DNA binding protein